MATFKEMVDETFAHLAGYGMRNDSLTYLTASMTSTATSLSVGSTESVGRGIAEIEDELVYIDSFDRSNNTLTLFPFGRGWLNTDAATHAVNTMVTINPSYTRKMVKQALNDTILAVFPDLFGISSYTFTYSPAVSTYMLPSSAETVLAVSYQSIGSSQEWRPVRGWRIDPMADASTFGSSNSLTLTSVVEPGRTVRVTYTTAPDALSSDSDDFSDTTGFPDSCKDVVIYGAIHRLLSMIPVGRMNFLSAEAQAQTSGIPFDSGTNLAKYVYALFQQRLAEEKRKLQEKFPVRVHFTN